MLQTRREFSPFSPYGRGDKLRAADPHASAWEWDNRQRHVAAAMNQYAQMKIARIAEVERQIAAEDDLSDLYRSSLGALLLPSDLIAWPCRNGDWSRPIEERGARILIVR